MTKIWSGMIQVELTSADPAGTLYVINDHRIGIRRLDGAGDLTVSFWVGRTDYPKLKRLCEKRGDELKILRKRGLYWLVFGLLRRPVLVACFLLLAVLSFFSPAVYFSSVRKGTV